MASCNTCFHFLPFSCLIISFIYTAPVSSSYSYHGSIDSQQQHHQSGQTSAALPLQPLQQPPQQYVPQTPSPQSSVISNTGNTKPKNVSSANTQKFTSTSSSESSNRAPPPVPTLVRVSGSNLIGLKPTHLPDEVIKVPIGMFYCFVYNK